MFRTTRRFLFAVIVGTTVFAASVSVLADTNTPATVSATNYLKGKHDTVQKLLKLPPGVEREKKIDAEFNTLIDFDEMAKAALGETWEKRTPAERKDFTDLLHQLIERNYKKRIDQTADYQVDYKGEDAKDSDIVVHTEVKNLKDKRETPVQIDYVVRKKAAGFMVEDLIPEGSSMVATYRKEFTKVINKDGWDALLKKMRDKLAKT